MSSVKKNFLYNSFYQILVLFIPLVTTPYISRVLSPNGVGIYSYHYSIAYYFSMFAILGLNNYGNRTIAETRDNKEVLSKTFLGIYITQIFCTIVVSGCYLLYCLIYANNNISYIFFFYVISSLLDVNWFLMGLENFKVIVTRNIFINIVSTICIFLFVKTENDLILYTSILIGSRILGLLSVFPFVLRSISLVKIEFDDIYKHIKPNLILFIPIIAVSLYKIMDKIMLGIMSTTIEVGYYESSEKIIKIPLALITSLGTVMLPRMSNIIARKSEQEVQGLFEKSLYFAIFLSSSCAFGIMLISKYFVPWFYGENYYKCIKIFQILMPSCIFLSIGNVIRTQFLIPYKRDSIFIKSVIFGAIINLIINFILIKKFESIGVSVGTLVAEAVVCLYQIWKTSKYINYKKIFMNSSPFIFAGILMYLSLSNLNLNFSSYFVNMIVLILVGCFLYFVFLFILFKILKMKIKEYF